MSVNSNLVKVNVDYHSSRGSLVYRNNNAPSSVGKAFRGSLSGCDVSLTSNGQPIIIDTETGEYLHDSSVEKDSRKDAWELKSIVDDLKPNSLTAKCQNWIVPKSKATVYRPVDKCKKAFFGGLQTCSSVWMCPICSRKISERRKSELQLAIEEAKKQGLSVAMLTLTAPHYLGTNLKEFKKKFEAAYTKSFKDRSGQLFLEKMGIVGRVRAYEITWGEKNGFHPHFHVLLFFKTDIPYDESGLHEAFYKIWRNACLKKGIGEPSFIHGVKFDLADSKVADYLAKYGRETTWGLESEMTKGHIKKSNGGYSMFDLLRAFKLTGDRKFVKIWEIFADAFKGARQLHWTKGLKDLLLVEDKTDEALAAEKEENAIKTYEFSFKEWIAIQFSRSQVYILKLVDSGGSESDIKNFVSGILELPDVKNHLRKLGHEASEATS